jgi:cytochrome bd-type quinol oxidase subunit 2
LREAKFEKKLVNKPESGNKNKRVEEVVYQLAIIMLTIICFIFNFLMALLLVIVMCEKSNIKMHDSIVSLYTRRILYIGIIIISLFMIFYQFSFVYGSNVKINAGTF